MYCVMRASVPSLHNVYRRYDMKGKNAENISYKHSGTYLCSICMFPVLYDHYHALSQFFYLHEDVLSNTGYTIPGTNNTDGYEIDNTPALIIGLTVALVLILSITAALTVTVLVRVCRGGHIAKRCR